MRVDFTVDAIPDQVRQNVALEELAAGSVVLAGGRNQARQLVRVHHHPNGFAGLE